MTAALLLVVTSLYAGFQWTIRVVVYPQFAAVPPGAFERFEARHQRLVSFAVGPLFIADGAVTAAAFVAGPRVPAAAAGLCLLVILGLTAFAAVPQHRRLSDGFDPAAHRRLLTVDTIRLVAAAAAVTAAIWYSR